MPHLRGEPERAPVTGQGHPAAAGAAQSGGRAHTAESEAGVVPGCRSAGEQNWDFTVNVTKVGRPFFLCGSIQHALGELERFMLVASLTLLEPFFLTPS